MPPTRRNFTRKDGGSLIKREGAEQETILSVKKELLEIQDRHSNLNNKLHMDLGLDQCSENL